MLFRDLQVSINNNNNIIIKKNQSDKLMVDEAFFAKQ